jgi:hypothetical protein
MYGVRYEGSKRGKTFFTVLPAFMDHTQVWVSMFQQRAVPSKDPVDVSTK